MKVYFRKKQYTPFRITLLSAMVVALLVVAVGVADAQEPSLTLPMKEQPGEPGDVARMFEAMVPRADLRYTKKTMQVLDTEIAYVDEGEGKILDSFAFEES